MSDVMMFGPVHKTSHTNLHVAFSLFLNFALRKFITRLVCYLKETLIHNHVFNLVQEVQVHKKVHQTARSLKSKSTFMILNTS